ncbi:MAG: MFS transporter [Blastocatellia bacterium]|nr:MFS transporter [Blastocatellia bacterium]
MAEGPMTDVQDSSYSWWRLGVSLALATIGGIGLWAAVVALPAIQTSFGIDRGGASLPYTATMIGFAAGGLVMGRFADRYGIAAPMFAGAAILGLGFFAAAAAPNYWLFVAAQAGLIGFLGCATTFGPLVADVSLWFRKRRGIAIGIVASGNYLAGTIWPPILTWGIEEYGWRMAYAGLGILVLVTMLPLSLLLRRRASLEDHPAPAAAQASTPFIGTPALQGLLVLAGLACCVAMSMPQVHIVAYCGDLGFGPARGAEMLSLMLGFGVVSRLASGFVADKIGGTGTLIIGSFLQGLALLFYIPFDGLVSLYVVSALFGLAQGGIVPSYALIVRDYFPAREAGWRISLVLTATVIGMALGGWLSGEIFDYTGSYRLAFVHGIIWNLLNFAIAVWLFARRAKPLHQRAAAA